MKELDYDKKVVLIVRRTRLEELIRRFNTEGQARFYIEHLGADFSDYRREHDTYKQALLDAQAILGKICRVQIVDRSFVPNFLFGDTDTVVVLGQDGLVANVLKYLNGQRVVAVNPDPQRWEGVLLPFIVRNLASIVPEVLRGQRPTKEVTMAKAELNTGQILYAVNDLFIGPKSHTSARYQIAIGGRQENHSSSGIIVSTGLGSTGWLRSIIAGATGIAGNWSGQVDIGRATNSSDWNGKKGSDKAGNPRNQSGPNDKATAGEQQKKVPWNARFLFFSVREPWPSKTSGADITFGKITNDNPLRLTSQMPENGVIFSDGIESDFLDFNSGTSAHICVAEKKGHLVQ